jgi:lysylphosphatidylglycerol synthetase-like protein (DUF2156 family)
VDYNTWVHTAGFLPSLGLVLAWYLLLRLVRRSVWPFALLTLPGTLAHEFTHLLVGWLVRAQPTGFSLWPQRHEAGGWRLGSVSFRNIHWINGAFVALAPLLLLPLAGFLLVAYAPGLWSRGDLGWWVGLGYLTATIVLAALPSWQDLKLGAASIALYVLLAGLMVWGLIAWKG